MNGEISNGYRHSHTTVRGKSPTYRTWDNMVQRCTNEKSTNWAYYGGKGVALASDWLKFSSFLADMGPRPEGMSLDRIDSNSGYCKANCRWASKNTQARNTKRTKLTPDLVRLIRSSPLPAYVLAKAIGCHKSTVSYARNGSTWGDIS